MSLEGEFSNFCEAKYRAVVGNGLDTIYLSLIALDINEHDEVLAPSNTYIATCIAAS